jgi:hypothetical protein
MTKLSKVLEMLTDVYNDLRANTDKMEYLDSVFENEITETPGTNFNDISFSILYDYINNNNEFLDRINEIIGVLRENVQTNAEMEGESKYEYN